MLARGDASAAEIEDVDTGGSLVDGALGVTVADGV
jgi:hypothetical protein